VQFKVVEVLLVNSHLIFGLVYYSV